jgi:hypothetical protein
MPNCQLKGFEEFSHLEAKKAKTNESRNIRKIAND